MIYFVRKISQLCFDRGFLLEEEREVYEYRLEIILSSMLTLAFILLLSAVLRMIIPTLFFLASYITLRTFAGGYHATTRWACFSLFTLCYVICVPMPWWVLPDVSLYVCGIVLVPLIVGLVFSYAPVAHPNNPLNYEERKANKKKSRIIVLVEVFVLSSGLLMTNWFCFFSGLLGVFAATVILFVGEVKYRENR